MKRGHWSDCAVHDAPALPAGNCDCGGLDFAVVATTVAEGERILTTGLLAKGASFKLIVSGHVGPKELERLIQKLELDKEILADATTGEAAN